jgi:hypothetical protein
MRLRIWPHLNSYLHETPWWQVATLAMMILVLLPITIVLAAFLIVLGKIFHCICSLYVVFKWAALGQRPPRIDHENL